MSRLSILGIDPGSQVTGVAVLNRLADGQLEVTECSVIRLDASSDHTARLKSLYQTITEYLHTYHPDSCAVETPVYGKDPSAMLKLGRAQAAALLAITNHDIPVSEYMPKAVKKSITGNGNADKTQVAYMLKSLLPMSEEKLVHDATDALAVAWCHLMKGNDGQNPAEGKSGSSISGWADFARNNPDRIVK